MIKFTIITCTYNAAGVLQRTLDSVLEQTCHHIEHLIIDGASKDATLQLANDYKQRSDEEENLREIRIISEPDNGLYDAMNKGIGLATGDYLLFLNAGDVFPSADTLELVAGSVGDGEELPGVLYGDTDIVNAEGRFLRHRHLQPPRKGLSWRSFRNGMLVCHQAFYA
ncbi:MAG: glycosyltransferase, partial [Prevotella sp.]|nr:glycosyltransferase [Prevotella sp.]